MPLISVTDVQAQLSSLLSRVEKGEEFIIARAGRPIARMVPCPSSTEPRRPGALMGQIKIADDFDQLPADVAEAFGLET